MKQDKINKNTEDSIVIYLWLISICIGLAVGAGIGAAVDRIGAGIGIGIAVGVSVGLFFYRRFKNNSGNK